MANVTKPSGLLLDEIETPIGSLVVVVDESFALYQLVFREGHRKRERSQIAATEAASTRASNPGGVSDVLRAYFEGELSALDGLVAAPVGTPFQRQVWAALCTIPCGTTLSYSELARRIGNPSAVRAVGLANGANPVAIVVPCHRVIGANGTLTGYGGGLDRKRWLLTHERALPRLELPFGAQPRSEPRHASNASAEPSSTR
jgi:methylated-DNA-[protein]-cysteine S-methyltransferase